MNKDIKTTVEQELLALARARVNLPDEYVSLRYEPDVDLLYVCFVECPRPTHSEDDQERGVIFHYGGRNLVSLEILDLYGIFVK